MEQLLTIELFGQPYTFRTDSDLNKAKEVADVLIQEVRRVEAQQHQAGTGITKQAMLVLAALNLATENLELKQEKTNLLETVSQRADTIVRRVAQRLAGTEVT